MAKKVVATFQTGSGKDYTKVIRMARSAKSGAYVFKENIVPNDAVKNFLASADK